MYINVNHNINEVLKYFRKLTNYCFDYLPIEQPNDAILVCIDSMLGR